MKVSHDHDSLLQPLPDPLQDSPPPVGNPRAGTPEVLITLPLDPAQHLAHVVAGVAAYVTDNTSPRLQVNNHSYRAGKGVATW